MLSDVMRDSMIIGERSGPEPLPQVLISGHYKRTELGLMCSFFHVHKGLQGLQSLFYAVTGKQFLTLQLKTISNAERCSCVASGAQCCCSHF